MKKGIKVVVLVGVLVSFLLVWNALRMSEDPEIAMDHLPCHQMPDGSWMGDCNGAQTTHALKTAGFLPEEEHVLESLPLAKGPSIVKLNNGDVFSLSADVVRHKIDNQEYVMYGYNQQIPGPILKVAQETTLKVDFTNNIDQETTIHWHGLRHDNKDDGVPGISQDPVKPGENFSYTVYFPDAGIYWYHPHVREDMQQDLGLAGNMLVFPLKEEVRVNREEVVILDDLLIEEGQFVHYGEEHANFALMGRFGNVLLVNGRTDYVLQVNKGDVVRFYLTNVANVRPFNLVIEGARMKLVGSDLGMYEKEMFVDNVIIAPAERYIVDVHFEEEGTYAIQNKNPQKVYELGKIRVGKENSQEDHSTTFNTLNQDVDVQQDIAEFKQYFNKPVDYTLDLSIEMNMVHDMDMMHEEETIEWEDTMPMMNRKMTTQDVRWVIKDRQTKEENMDFVMNAKVGDVLKIRLVNDPDSGHPMQHPIHLHGQRFLVIEENGVLNDNLVWKDTVLVPKGNIVDILVDVTNPGEWMMHCHIAEHLEAGMMTSLVVE